MSDDTGYIRLYRQLKDKAFYKDSEKLHLWIHLLLKATHRGREELLGGKPILCKPGQFTVGRKQLASETGIQESKIERILTYFEKTEQQIEQQKTSKNRMITILNWVSYQYTEQQIEQQVNNKRTTSEQQVNNKRTTSEQQTTHYNNVLNDLNVSNDINDNNDLILLEREIEEDGFDVDKQTKIKKIKQQMAKDDAILAESITKMWNDICTSYKPVLVSSLSRIEKIRNIVWELKSVDKVKLAFLKIEESNFCKGENDKKWVASFDWVFKDVDNIIKVLEGKYDNKKTYWDKIREEGDPLGREDI